MGLINPDLGPSRPRLAAGIRNSYADLLRAAAIVAIVFGHWLATAVVSRDGQLTGVDALGVITWGSWVTLVLQVVPVFFFVGGYANGGSWSRRQAEGQDWSSWVRARVARLLIPTAAYVALISFVVLLVHDGPIDPTILDQAGWALALHLWFVAAYIVVLLATPALYALHRRWGLWVPVAMAAAATIIDTGVIEQHWPVIGWLNYLLVWGTFHQLGFAWRDGTLTAHRRPLLLTAGALVSLIGLIWWGPYPVSMVGVAGARIQNASPPSTALLAFGLVQIGLATLAEPVTNRWLARHRRGREAVAVAGRLTMPVYLCHMVPVVILIEAGYPRLGGVPAIGSTRWWQQRPDWIAALAVTLAALLVLLVLVAEFRRRYRWTPTGGVHLSVNSAAVSALALVAGIVSSAVGIGLLAINGLAPDGHVNYAALVALGVGLALVSVRKA